MNETYLGLDLADPYAAHVRPSTLAILGPDLNCEFEDWHYSQAGEDLPPIRVESTHITLAIDGPQGLAGASGMTMRLCERKLGTAGKSPYGFPNPTRIYAGLIRGSVLLFYTLYSSNRFRLFGAPSSSSAKSNLLEVYPGGAWPLLAGGQRLAKKRTISGRGQRRMILEAQGMQFPTSLMLTHDHLDAALCAWVAYLHYLRKTWWVGAPPVADTEKDTRMRVLREGYIVQPPVVAA